MEEIKNTVEVAKGIGDYGMMAVTAAFFLVISAVMMMFFVKWFLKMIDNIVENQKVVLDQLSDKNDKQTILLKKISESFVESSLSRIKALTSFAFDLSIEQICKVVKKIRYENNIADKEATREKILHLLKNLHDDRNTKLDNFTYSGKPLSFYTEEKWIKNIAKVVENEVYEEKENNGRTYTNVKLAYDSVRLEFYKNLRLK